MRSLFRIKVILVGDYGVSKTSMLSAVLTQKNGTKRGHPLSGQYSQTENELHVKSSLRDDPVVMAIWDTCGKCDTANSFFE